MLLSYFHSWADNGALFEFEDWMIGPGVWDKVEKVGFSDGVGATYSYTQGVLRDVKAGGSKALVCEVDCRGPQ